MPEDVEKKPRHLGVWIFTYRKEKIARNKNQLISGEYFNQTKILTLFFHYVDDDKVLVIFTENAGKAVIDLFEVLRE